MTVHQSLQLAGLLAIVALNWSCKKQQDNPVPVLVVTATANSTVTPTIIPTTYTPAPPTRNQPEFVFDWENAQYVPNPATVTPIPVPWSDQARRAFSDDIRYDYKKADGWEMVYSTFNKNGVVVGTPDLILYNKYRGILRFYYYTNFSTQAIQGNNVTVQRLSSSGTVYGSSSPLLNFAEQAIIDIDKNSVSYSTMEPQVISDNTWYAVQAELAYDPKLVTQSYEKFSVSWYMGSDKVNTFTINGSQPLTTLPVGLHIENVDFTRNQSPLAGTAQLLVNGSHGLANLQAAGQDVGGLTVNLAQTTNGSLLSGILSTPNTATSVFLPVSAAIQLVYPLGHSAAITAPSLALPGYDNSRTSGIGPQYNEAPGIFYLDSKPVITTQTATTGSTAYTYTLDVASVRYIFNPAVTNIADIRNIRQEIVATATPSPETVPTSTSTLYTGTSLTANQALTVLGVRVSFDVVPNSGSSPVHIIKTFKADVKPQ